MPRRIHLMRRGSDQSLELDLDPRATPHIGDEIEVAMDGCSVAARVVHVSTYPATSPEVPLFNAVYAREI
jgi:hypothetical protein